MKRLDDGARTLGVGDGRLGGWEMGDAGALRAILDACPSGDG